MSDPLNELLGFDENSIMSDTTNVSMSIQSTKSNINKSFNLQFTPGKSRLSSASVQDLEQKFGTSNKKVKVVVSENLQEKSSIKLQHSNQKVAAVGMNTTKETPIKKGLSARKNGVSVTKSNNHDKSK